MHWSRLSKRFLIRCIDQHLTMNSFNTHDLIISPLNFQLFDFMLAAYMYYQNEEGTSLGITITTGCNLSDHAVVAFENVSSWVGKKMATVYISPVILPFTVYFTIKLLSWQKLEEWRICQGKAGFYIGMLSTIIGKHIQDIQHKCNGIFFYGQIHSFILIHKYP